MINKQRFVYARFLNNKNKQTKENELKLFWDHLKLNLENSFESSFFCS